MKAPPNHIKTVLDGLQLFSWIFSPDRAALKSHLEEANGQIQFYGNKVLGLNKDKDSEWFLAYRDLAQKFVDFVIANGETILNWTGSEDAAGVEAFLNQAHSAAPAQAAPAKVEEKKEEVKAVAKAAPKVKAPVREFRNKIWSVENFGAEEVVFNEDELEKNHRFSIINC